MLHSSTKRLIDKLDEMTRKQRVSWEESDNGSVKHDTEGYRVILTAAPHSLLLTDTQGREIETCTPEDFSGETDAAGRPYSEFIGDLYNEAHRYARGAEQAISALLSSLDEADADEPAPVEDAASLAAPESFDHPEDAGDESYPLEDHELPEPEYEGQAEMQAAIATMADQMNAPPPAASHMAEDSELDAAPAAEPEPAVEPPAMPVFATEPQAEPEPETVAQAEPEPEPYVPFAGSAETARIYAVAAEFVTPAEAEPPMSEAVAEPPEAEAAPEAAEPFSAENDVWDTIRSAGEPSEAPAEVAESESASEEPAIESAPEPEPVTQQPAASLSRPGPVFGSGMFSDLSRYRTQAPASEPEPEPAGETVMEAETEADAQPAPEPAPAPEQPAAPRSFSLSGITSGFGLGSTHSPHRSEPETPPEPAEPAGQKLIDGTLDLPDTLPEEEDAAPGKEWRMEQDEEFGFTEEDLMPGMPAEPVPAVTETAPAAPAPEPQASDPQAEPGSDHPARPARRFNPWN